MSRGPRGGIRESGWCETAHHERCPELIRPEYRTPKGQNLRQIVCACSCHKPQRRAR